MNVALESYYNCKRPDKIRLYEGWQMNYVTWKCHLVANPQHNYTGNMVHEMCSKSWLAVQKY